jgi:hypothetical protein
MLDKKPDNVTKVILAGNDSTINQAVTLRVMSMADCGERKFPEISRNYLITGWASE